MAGEGERVRPSLHSLSSPLAAREAGAEGGKKEGWVSVRYACVREKESYTSSIGKRRKKVFVCHRGWVIPQCGILGTGGGGEKEVVVGILLPFFVELVSNGGETSSRRSLEIRASHSPTSASPLC